MTWAVRALSVFLTVWMTGAAAFPPCCWSMADGHEHQAQQDAAASAVPAHDHHHHHGSTEPAAPAEALAVSAVPAHDCDTEFAEAIATPRPSRSSLDLRVVMAAPTRFTMPHATAPRAGLSAFTPPAAPFDAAFLSPLRV